MAIQVIRPLTPGQRGLIRNSQPQLAANNPEKSLTGFRHCAKGRNNNGRITTRRRGGGHKKLYRTIDFRRARIEVPAVVLTLEYDPNRTAHIALIQYQDGEKAYILAPDTLKVGDTVLSTNKVVERFDIGYSMPLKNIAPATFIHAIEMAPGGGAQYARSAGVYAQVLGQEGYRTIVKMPSGEQRYLNGECRATIGIVSNLDHSNATLGKAGRNRWLGKRPRVRGMVMNPVDHPNGGGQGKSKGGGGRQHPESPWGQLAKGFPTRQKAKASNKDIIVRRNGKKFKKA